MNRAVINGSKDRFLPDNLASGDVIEFNGIRHKITSKVWNSELGLWKATAEPVETEIKTVEQTEIKSKPRRPKRNTKRARP